MVSEEVAEKLMPKFSRRAEEREQKLISVANGSIEQLHDLVKLVATNAVIIYIHLIYKLYISHNSKLIVNYVNNIFIYSIYGI